MSSACTAASASLATRTGRPVASRGASRSGTSVQPRLGAVRTVPSRSTTPGVPTPMPSTGSGDRAIVPSTSSRTTAGSTPTALGRVDRCRALVPDEDVAVEVEHRGLEPRGHREVDAEAVQTGAVEVDEGGALARARPARRCRGRGRGPLDELGDEVRDGHLRDADLPGQLGPARRAEALERLEHEREVLPAAVGGEHGRRWPHTARHCAAHRS